MTSLNHDPSQPQPATPAPAAGAVRPPVSAEVAREHDNDHWNRQIIAAEQESRTSSLRIKIIAGVIILGVVVWLALTL